MKNNIPNNALPFEDYSRCLGKTIIKIGICPHHNTCRIVFDDGSLLWVQSLSDEQLLLKHGLFAKFLPQGQEAQELGNSSHIKWDSLN